MQACSCLDASLILLASSAFLLGLLIHGVHIKQFQTAKRKHSKAHLLHCLGKKKTQQTPHIINSQCIKIHTCCLGTDMHTFITSFKFFIISNVAISNPRGTPLQKKENILHQYFITQSTNHKTHPLQVYPRVPTQHAVHSEQMQAPVSQKREFKPLSFIAASYSLKIISTLHKALIKVVLFFFFSFSSVNLVLSSNGLNTVKMKMRSLS